MQLSERKAVVVDSCLEVNSFNLVSKEVHFFPVKCEGELMLHKVWRE